MPAVVCFIPSTYYANSKYLPDGTLGSFFRNKKCYDKSTYEIIKKNYFSSILYFGLSNKSYCHGHLNKNLNCCLP